jgi:hypothetical protein
VADLVPLADCSLIRPEATGEVGFDLLPGVFDPEGDRARSGAGLRLVPDVGQPGGLLEPVAVPVEPEVEVLVVYALCPRAR